jgi:hypothetical protein
MRTLFALTLTAALIATLPMAGAQQPSQQEKMKTCNSQASSQNLNGDARKTFMSSCLKSTSGSGSTSSSTTGNSQQDKMKTCNSQAASQSLNGDARKSFMSSCLKGQ